MWRCKKCGYEIVAVNAREHFKTIDKNGKQHHWFFGKYKKTYLECVGCRKVTTVDDGKITIAKMKRIADWQL